MTTPGPDHFFSCPHCKKILRRWTITSGNTFGSTLWTDGYLDAPMLPSVVEVTRCPSCNAVFFVEDAEDLGEHWPGTGDGESTEGSLPVGFDDAPTVDDAEPDALAELICQMTDRNRLRYLCVRSWHLHNNPYRGPQPAGPAQRPAGFDENLRQLIGVLDDDGGQEQLMKAEALRELGKHAAALETLESLEPELQWAADQICSMAQAGDNTVKVLNRPGK